MRKISDAERIETYFRTAAEPDASRLIERIMLIHSIRFPADMVLSRKPKRGRKVKLKEPEVVGVTAHDGKSVSHGTL